MKCWQHIIEQTLEDMEDERKEARKAYENDKSDEFHMYMDTIYGLVVEMFRSRLATLCDD